MSLLKNNDGTCVPGLLCSDLRAAPSVASEEITRDEGSDDYAKLLDQYGSVGSLTEGEVVKGRVLKVTAAEVVIDVGFKSEGIIPLQEFIDSAGSINVKAGDEIEVLLESAEDQEGHIVLSREKAERVKAWDDIERAFRSQVIVKGIVVDRIKGGLSVDIGAKAFLPGSQIDVRPVKNLDSFRGQIIECKIIKINKRRGNIVLSRKLVLEERNSSRTQMLSGLLEEGVVLQGMVKNITDYGVFVDLGGMDGLLHVTDISWGRASHPSKVFALGSEIQVKILKFDRERQRVSLGYKQLYPDPWTSVLERYPVGTRVCGKVISLTEYGAFLEIEEGIEGFVPVSEMSWNKRIKSPSRLLTIGDTVDAVVLDINPPERRLALGLKQIGPDPWKTLAERYSVGDVITGEVRNLTDFGAFIEVEEGIDGLVHISDLSWTRKVKHPSELVKKGEQVRAVVLRMDPENHRLSLGIKQLQPDTWQEFFSRHHVGQLVRGRITHLAPFGAFVDLEGGIEGLCHVSQFQESENSQSAKLLVQGETQDFTIIRLLPHERKIGLAVPLTGKVEGSSYSARACAQVGPAQADSANSQAGGEIQSKSQSSPD
jgi:small subunit ribosomal protein S1